MSEYFCLTLTLLLFGSVSLNSMTFLQPIQTPKLCDSREKSLVGPFRTGPPACKSLCLQPDIRDVCAGRPKLFQFGIIFTVFGTCTLLSSLPMPGFIEHSLSYLFLPQCCFLLFQGINWATDTFPLPSLVKNLYLVLNFNIFHLRAKFLLTSNAMEIHNLKEIP